MRDTASSGMPKTSSSLRCEGNLRVFSDGWIASTFGDIGSLDASEDASASGDGEKGMAVGSGTALKRSVLEWKRRSCSCNDVRSTGDSGDGGVASTVRSSDSNITGLAFSATDRCLRLVGAGRVRGIGDIFADAGGVRGIGDIFASKSRSEKSHSDSSIPATMILLP